MASHTVAKLPSSNTLDGAFRVHLPPESLEQAHLKVGDVCEIVGEDGARGHGIAWRAGDRMSSRPGSRSVKITEIARNAFNFKEGAKVTIKSTKAAVVHAKRIHLSELPSEDEAGKPNDTDDCRWHGRIKYHLDQCEALATGSIFQVSGKKNLRKTFRIDSFESDEKLECCLFLSDDNSGLVLAGYKIASHLDSNTLAATPSNGGEDTQLESRIEPYHLETQDIGGLVEQCQYLEETINDVLYATRGVSIPPLLIHGYEGTGKSMLVNRLAQAPFRSVTRLDRTNLSEGTVMKNKAIVRESFATAVANRPALILMDDLERIAPIDDTLYACELAQEITQLRGLNVLVIGVTQSPLSLAKEVAAIFTDSIEFPIPDEATRAQVLRAFYGQSTAPEQVCTFVAGRTHGYTCKDLWTLYDQSWKKYRIRQRRSASSLPETDERPSAPEQEDFEVVLTSQKIKPAALREIFTTRPRTRWADIGGAEGMRQRFDEIIGWPLHHKAKLAAMPKFRPTKGVLLYGPPGCSKTLTAQAIAHTYNMNFIAIQGAALISMYVGESERAVRNVFAKARLAAPCIIFFDEIDAIGASRDDGGGGAKGLNVLTTLLNEMDGFEPLKDVMVLAATNKPAALDAALMRPGRFDAHVYLGPPDVAARREILNIETAGGGGGVSADLDDVAAQTAGYSGAEVVQICQKAREGALRRQIRAGGDDDLPVQLEQADFEAALDTTRKGISAEMLEDYERFAQITKF